MRNQKTIVIVEDDKNIGTLVETIVSKMGHQPILTASGEEALEIFENKAIDLLITDFKLPRGIDGLTIIRLFRKRFSHANAILITAYSDFEIARKAAVAGAMGFQSKPLDLEKFEQSINMCLIPNGTLWETYKNKTVLIVENDPDFLDFLKTLCVLRHMFPIGVPDAEEAVLIHVGAVARPINLVVSNVKLPGRSGFELSQRIKSDASLRHIPVLLFSVSPDPKLSDAGFEKEAKKVNANFFACRHSDPFAIASQITQML